MIHHKNHYTLAPVYEAVRDTIEVEDDNICTFQQGITLTEPEELLIDQTNLLTYNGGFNISCNGESDGEVIVTTTGGNLPHQVSVNGENKEINATTTNVTFTGLAGRTYQVLITDANGCTDTRNITFTEPDLYEVSNIDIPTYFGGYNLRCRGDSDAVSTIRTTGGAYPHLVTVNGVAEQINSPAESAVFNNLPAGLYTVDIIDANNCTNQTTFTVTEPGVFQLDATKTIAVQPECFGDNTASLTLEAAGGVLINGSHYRYIIEHQNVPPDLPFPFDARQEQNGVNVTFNNLIAGEYLVSVYDHFGQEGVTNGCRYQETIEITTINQLTIDLQSSNITCKAETSGSATLRLSGGTAPYTVIWQNDQRQAIETDIINAGEAAMLAGQGDGLYYLRISLRGSMY